ncbi:hypothetical protein E2C01_054561 [Portunus trituberculatus]|uniref:Uncharacterized protein n=1 Tax=Portunus trituberculatus TaxID=210409 RepID=A0A5B7GVD0_PORTR|nr:hypothetical protein [Portunus trituberculatus]
MKLSIGRREERVGLIIITHYYSHHQRLALERTGKHHGKNRKASLILVISLTTTASTASQSARQSGTSDGIPFP